MRGRDDEGLANPGQHEDGKRVVDHRLVVDGDSCFVTASVIGCSLVPAPPARMMPFRAASIKPWPRQSKSLAGVDPSRSAATSVRYRGTSAPSDRCPYRRSRSATTPGPAPAWRVDGIAVIVAGSVGDIGDLRPCHPRRGAKFIEEAQIGPRPRCALGAAADDVCLAGPGRLEDAGSARAWSLTSSQSRTLRPSP